MSLFDQLVIGFELNFISYKLQKKKPTIALIAIQYKEDEPRANYTKRFSKKVRVVSNLNP